MFGVAYDNLDGDWFVEYRGKQYRVIGNNDLPAIDHRKLLIGLHRNERVHFDLEKGPGEEVAIITRIGRVKPLMVKSLKEFCRKPKDVWRFVVPYKHGSRELDGVPTVSKDIMKEAGLKHTVAGDKLMTEGF